jgi:hypothetical protein
MRKEKREKIEFNPSDYDYMDNLQLAGWIWEVIRRSKEYHAFYEKLSKSTRKPRDQRNSQDDAIWKEYMEKYSPIFPKHPDDTRKWPLLLMTQKKQNCIR